MMGKWADIVEKKGIARKKKLLRKEGVMFEDK